MTYEKPVWRHRYFSPPFYNLYQNTERIEEFMATTPTGQFYVEQLNPEVWNIVEKDLDHDSPVLSTETLIVKPGVRLNIVDVWQRIVERDQGERKSLLNPAETALANSHPRVRQFQHEGMTLWTDSFSAQARDGEMAFHIMDGCERSTEDGNPALIPYKDLLQLKYLIEAIDDRGEFDDLKRELHVAAE